jgi:hypothetical protein
MSCRREGCPVGVVEVRAVTGGSLGADRLPGGMSGGGSIQSMLTPDEWHALAMGACRVQACALTCELAVWSNCMGILARIAYEASSSRR